MLADASARLPAEDTIRVVARFRPQNAREIQEGGAPVVSFNDDMTSVQMDNKDYPGMFNFDRVFDWNATQDLVFSYSARATIDDVMRGYNGTIFAYGQTGSGKTHTMMGQLEDEELKGLTPRIVESIFSTIFSSPPHMEFTVKVSYMEIYMEKIRDLLNPTSDNLPLKEEKGKGVYVKGLLEVFVGSVDEVYEALRVGQKNRMVASTKMNAESSRSHSVFLLTITQKNLTDGTQKAGKLYLVDLAGSERLGKTGAVGQTLEEAKKINLSLSALGNVINALTDNKSTHIPYRDSKLTRILQESLGGNSRTTLIINASPSSFNEDETLSTLRFGMRAKTIKNKARMNVELSPAELKLLLKKSKAEIVSLQNYCSALEGEINIWRTDGTVPQSEWVTADNFVSPMATGAPATAVAASTGDISRPGTAGPSLADDEREEFLRREGDLSEELAQKEHELAEKRKEADSLLDELNALRSSQKEVSQENKDLNATVNDLRLQLEKISFENTDNTITVDSLKDANAEMAKEVDNLKKRIIELESSKPVLAISDEDRQRRKAERMKLMMGELDVSDMMAEKELQIRATLSKLAYQRQHLTPPTDPAQIEAQHFELLDTKEKLIRQEGLLEELMSKTKSLELERTFFHDRKQELENKLNGLQGEYVELLERTMREEIGSARPEVMGLFEELKTRLEQQYDDRREVQEKELEDYKFMLGRKDEELARFAEQAKLTHELKDAQSNEEIDKLRKLMADQLRDFDISKKKLMRDLQNRCEKVVELEISLDEVRSQYENILKTSNSRASQQKMAFLERNFEQLTAVQKNLVEQNTTLKKEIGVAERKLAARNDRIAHLEQLLNDAQVKLDLQNQKFEAQLASMREKVQEAKAQSIQAGSWVPFSRIAKPLRGGGSNFVAAGDDEGTVLPAFSLGDLGSAGSPVKRSSWYVSLLKKN
ncbi:P-loop containing nucleoside triphosphate hydrolase protein [Gaertneriomyces semiglobifer]|nr:P-loop containing nucleoside triphosphate hydrolase protein [Gaertneriomyces semiglobifer]